MYRNVQNYNSFLFHALLLQIYTVPLGVEGWEKLLRKPDDDHWEQTLAEN